MSSILVPVVLIGLLGDIPLSMVIVAMFHPTHPALIQVGVAALGLLGLGWAIAARSALRAIPHVVSHDALWIGGDIRIAGVIPRAAIERALVIRGSRREWMSEHKVTRDDVILASGFDPPNLAVEIKKTAWEVVQVTKREKQGSFRRWVLLYADKPAALAATAQALADP